MDIEPENTISLYEVLVKTSYQTQITEPDDKECANPVAFGSGFIVEFDGTNFFVTADHTVHLDDYEEKEERTWKDYVVSIFNNYSPPDNFLSTVVTPLGGFYYMEQFHLDKPDSMPKPVDITVCIMKQKHFQYPFLTTGIKFSNEEIKQGEQKFKIKPECFSEPNTNDTYCVFGAVKTDIKDNIKVEREFTLKHSLKFVSKSGDFYLFNTPNVITDRKDWKGLSGSPVLSEAGDCVGVICDVLENSQSIWVIPMTKVKMLIEVAIQQEALENSKSETKEK